MKKTPRAEDFNHISVLQIGFGQVGRPLYKHLKSFFNDITLVRHQKDLSKAPQRKFDFAFLATPDQALKEVISIFPDETKVIHFSGFSHFPHALGLHPVMSFGQESEVDFLELTYVSDGPVPALLQEVFQKIIYIKPELKKIYHTYLSVAANSMQLLTHLLAQNFEEATELPKSLLKDLVQVSLEKEKVWGSQSFSGPWVRGENQNQSAEVKNINDPVLSALNACFLESIKEFKNEHS